MASGVWRNKVVRKPITTPSAFEQTKVVPVSVAKTPQKQRDLRQRNLGTTSVDKAALRPKISNITQKENFGVCLIS